MSTLIPVGLRRQRVASILLALFFLALELAWFLLLAFLLMLNLRWGLASSSALAVAAFAGAVFNTWGLARVVKNGHFLWQYGRWPVAEPAHGERGLDLLQSQARQAFVDDDMERVVLLASKLEASQRPLELGAGLGRALALLGRLDEAASVFREQGAEAESLRWLQPRRAWGLDRPIYFKPSDARWARRHLSLALLAALSALASLWVTEAAGDLLRGRRVEAFDRQGFKVSQEGPFTFYYHDPAFRDLVADLAGKALRHQLAFLDREPAVIPEGTFRFYLCEDREEYLARAPYAPAWEQASALPALNSIYIHKLPADQRIYFESVLAHELSHLLYHRFFPVKANDAWLNEGLADYLGYAFALDRAGFARQDWLQRHSFKGLAARALPFDQFFAIDPHSLSKTEDVVTFYRQGFSVVFLLVEHYGREAFLGFLDAYRLNGGDAARALAVAYPSIQGTSDLAAVWDLFFRLPESK
jgi:hypothetical protein